MNNRQVALLAAALYSSNRQSTMANDSQVTFLADQFEEWLEQDGKKSYNDAPKNPTDHVADSVADGLGGDGEV